MVVDISVLPVTSRHRSTVVVLVVAVLSVRVVVSIISRRLRDGQWLLPTPLILQGTEACSQGV